MHIISGKYKGRIIKRPKDIRATQDKVRKALFDILDDVRGEAFLDLYAGSGAVGLEAISQGVSKTVFVEKDRRCCEMIKENIEILDTGSRALGTGFRALDKKQGSRISDYESILPMDVFRAIPMFFKNQQKFNSIFLDPPYYQGLAEKTLKTIGRHDIVACNGLIICQHFKKDILPKIIASLKLIKQAKYGDTILSFYREATNTTI
ncbi:MAG: 16S rRNA (guanine(966)-N(2))-methyltransferase RsmD [Candidatus Omnitrophica bacterium]|nr:16S rRNA (guanine(966)-N(2))-methyltransferase RsmD [Candidatus Omnitrophota bacterium]